PDATDAELKAQCTAIQNQVGKANVNRAQATACGTYLTAASTVDDDTAALAWALDWQRRRANVSEGQFIFETNCARCHTEGWSIFDPTEPNGTDVLGLSGGGGGQGGGIGFNLRDGGEARRFGSDIDGGFQAQVDFVTLGSDEFKAYGRGGIGSGRMPGFGE